MGTADLASFGPSTGPQSIELAYVIDAVDYDDARTTMFAAAPMILGLFVPNDFRITPIDGSDTLFNGSLTYGPRSSNSLDQQYPDPTYSFDLGVERQKITQSLATVGKYGAGAPDFKGAINVQDDRTVEGVEINFPVFSWIETHYLPYETVGRAYFLTLFNLVAKMNVGPFRDFARGEVLFLGVNGSKRRSAADWEMQFKFIASPNATNLAIGPDLTVTEKLGHDYLWVRYKSSRDTGANALVRIPQHAFVERVYQFEDLNKLKLVNPLAL